MKQLKKIILYSLWGFYLSFSLFSQAAELEVNIETSPATALLNEELTYTLSVTVLPSETTTVVKDIVLTYALPPSFDLISVETSQGQCGEGRVVECTLAHLEAQELIVSVVVVPTEAGAVSGIIEASGTTLDDNNEQVSTRTTTPVDTFINEAAPTASPGSAAAADLSMSVAVLPTPALVNTQLSYQINVFPVPASAAVENVSITYGVPPTFTLVSAQTSQGTCQANGVVECALGTLTEAVDVTLVVLPTQTGAVNSAVNASGFLTDASGQSVSISKTEPINLTVEKPAPVQVGFSEASYTVREKAGLAVITVTRSGESDRAIAVDYFTRDDSARAAVDYVAVSGTLTWLEGDTEAKTFEIPITNDLRTETDESVKLFLANPQEATLERAQAQLIITDDEIPGELSFVPNSYSVSELDGQVILTVHRGTGSDGVLSVNYFTTDDTAIAGQDYTATNGTLIWGDGETEPKTVTIEVLEDDAIEGEEKFRVVLTEPSNQASLKQAIATVNLNDHITTAAAVAALTAVAQNPTQQALATTIGRLCQSGQAGADLQARCRELIVNAQNQPQAVAQALQQLAPEEYATQGRLALEAGARQVRNISSRLMALRSGASGLSVEGVQLNINGDAVPLNGGDEYRLRGEPLTRQADESASLTSGLAHLLELHNVGIFVNGHLGFGDKSPTANESGFDFNTIGLTGGADYRFTDTFIAGLALGYQLSKADLQADGGEIELQGLNLGLYATYYQPKVFYFDIFYSYGISDYDNSRPIAYNIAGTQINQMASSNPGGEQHILSLSGGYHFNFNKLTLTPTVRIDSIETSIDSFEETTSTPEALGSGLGIGLTDQTISSLTLAFGGQLALEVNLASGTVLVPQLNLEWVMETDNKQRLLSGYFVEDRGQERFSLATDEADKNYLNLGLGLAAQLATDTAAFINYETLVLSDVTSHSIMAGVRLEF